MGMNWQNVSSVTRCILNRFGSFQFAMHDREFYFKKKISPYATFIKYPATTHGTLLLKPYHSSQR